MVLVEMIEEINPRKIAVLQNGQPGYSSMISIWTSSGKLSTILINASKTFSFSSNTSLGALWLFCEKNPGIDVICICNFKRPWWDLPLVFPFTAASRQRIWSQMPGCEMSHHILKRPITIHARYFQIPNHQIASINPTIVVVHTRSQSINSVLFIRLSPFETLMSFQETS